MADISKSLLDAISVIANKTADEVSSDKTIKAIVKKVISTSEGKYLITYNSGDFYAYVQSGSKDVYQVGEQIYVLVPAGDMSQKKFIIGKVQEENEQNTITRSSLLNDYTLLGDNAVIEKTYKAPNNLYTQRMQPLALDSHSVSDFYYCYLRDTSEIDGLRQDYDSLTYPIITIDEDVFTNSAKQAEALLVRAKFKASLDTEDIGNYGIIVNVAFADTTNPQTDENGNTTYPPKLVAYILDISKMTGNPMKFYDYTSQYLVASFDGTNYLYIDSVVAFSEGFVNRKESKHTDDDDIHIYINDIEIIALDEISAINGDYKLQLTTPQGNTLKVGEDNNIKIVAKANYLNQDITKSSLFYWGLKDPSIISTDEFYNAKLGSGYKYIETGHAGELNLTPKDLTAAENIFKCVAIYESEIILKTEISIYNNNNKLDITIESDQGTNFQFNEGSPTLTCLINGKSSEYSDRFSDSAFSFIWSKVDDESGNILLNETEAQLLAAKDKELQECSQSSSGISDAGRTAMQVLSYYSTRINQVQNISYPAGINGPKIQCKLKTVNTNVTYSCSVYRSGVYIGYGSITLQNSKDVVNNNYYITITNGNQVFQYDESGVAPNSEKKAEPVEILDLTAVFHSPQGAEVTPKSVRWIVPIENTMLDVPSLGLTTNESTGERSFIGDTYPLAIKDTYNSSYNNNQVIAVVTHSDGTEYRQPSNLLFTKVGEIGTNGTDTVVKINELITAPEDEYLTIIKGSTGAGHWNDENQTPLTNAALDVALYTNNTLGAGYTATWTMAGSSKNQSRHYGLEGLSDNSVIVSYNGDSEELDTRIAEVEVTSNGKYYYSFYGIPAIEYQGAYDSSSYPIKILRDGTLKSILYDSNGTNPAYEETQGAHVELHDWPQTGYLKWEVESGPTEQNQYNNPNFLLSKSPSSKTGSRVLTADSSQDSQDFILEIQDTVNACAANANENIRNYINRMTNDIENIIRDSLLSNATKLTNIKNKLTPFLNNAPNKNNVYVKNVYAAYTRMYNRMKQEFEEIQSQNKVYTDIYNKVQSIWQSEWPSVITKNRLHTTTSSNINNMQSLILAYQGAYEDRSKDSNKRTVPSAATRSNWYDSTFRTILTKIDEYYNNYYNSLVGAKTPNKDLLEYCKVLAAYINLLIDETYNLYKDNDDVSERYITAYGQWYNNPAESIGKEIYNAVIDCGDIIANITTSMRGIYIFYQSMFGNVKKYQITEESDILNTYAALLDGQDPEILNQIYVIANDKFNGLYMNNNIVGTAYIKSGNNNIEIAKIYIPIIMTLNTYELAALNGWDGTSVEIGDDHIMTPQIGAGIKDPKTNKFTGMVMGAIGNKTNEADKVGLMGYSDGRQSAFIDSKTGAAYFGLAADDDETNEGRIELIPGGVSKIGNWKIGNRFLYNIIGGNYEKRRDDDSRNRNAYKLMVPHDKYGIMLSADQPYVHIKGELYENENLTGIDYNDEYNNINPGDGLELRLDPGDKSLFSIVQHTSGFGEEAIDDLHFGYSFIDDGNVVVVQDYIANKNVDKNGSADAQPQIGEDIEYYIYRLRKSGNIYYPYYTQSSNVGKSFSSTKTAIANTYVPSNGISHDDSNTAQQVFNNMFSINKDTGIITYTPNTSKFLTGWRSVTGTTRGTNFNVILNVNTTVETTDTLAIGSITNNTGRTVYKMVINISNYSVALKEGFNTSGINKIQWYITSSNSGTIENAILQSEVLNATGSYSVIELTSAEGVGLMNNTTYYLRADIEVGSARVNTNFIINAQSSSSNIYWPEIENLPHGYIEISSQQTTAKSFTAINAVNGAATGSYTVNTSNVLTLTGVSTNYDVVVWRENSNSVIGGGRGTAFYPTSWSSSTNTTLSLGVNPSNTTVYIGFYDRNTVTSTREVADTSSSSQTNGTNHNSGSGGNTSGLTVTQYRFTGMSLIQKSIYTKTIGSVTTGSKTTGILYNFTWGNIYGYIPNSTQYLCVEGDLDYRGIQGIPYAKTSWKLDESTNELIQYISFYNTYYQTVRSNSDLTQYGYITLVDDGNTSKPTYYKYIKTLQQATIDNLFTKSTTASDWPENFTRITDTQFNQLCLTGPEQSPIFQDAIYWKEFLRVGLDENGRLFTNGAFNKKTYSRTGNLFAFGKTPDLYGLEVRTEVLSDSINKLAPVIKIFTQATTNSTANTTYITQGKNDTGNISIRTAKSDHYVELAASEDAETDDNTIPIKTTYISVSHGNGIQIQARDGNNKGSITRNGLVFNLDTLDLSIGNNITNYMSGNYSGITSPYYTISSISGKPSTVYNTSTTGTHYKITASEGGINLWSGANSHIQLTSSQILLQRDSERNLSFGSSNIELQNDSTSIIMHDGGASSSYINITQGSSYMKLLSYNNTSQYIQLYSNRGSTLQVSDSVKITSSGGFIVSGGTGCFENQLYTKANLYSYGDVFVGQNYSGGGTQSAAVKIFGKGGRWTRLAAAHIKQLFYWYNHYRWVIWAGGNSANIQRIDGSYDAHYYTFSGYSDADNSANWTSY